MTSQCQVFWGASWVFFCLMVNSFLFGFVYKKVTKSRFLCTVHVSSQYIFIYTYLTYCNTAWASIFTTITAAVVPSAIFIHVYFINNSLCVFPLLLSRMCLKQIKITLHLATVSSDLVCSPVHPSLSARVDVDEQQPLHHVGVVQLKHINTT